MIGDTLRELGDLAQACPRCHRVRELLKEADEARARLCGQQIEVVLEEGIEGVIRCGLCHDLGWTFTPKGWQIVAGIRAHVNRHDEKQREFIAEKLRRDR